MQAARIVTVGGGVFVGDLLGLSVGDLLGLSVGDLLGLFVGDLLGVSVGDLLGLSVGDMVGLGGLHCISFPILPPDPKNISVLVAALLIHESPHNV